MKHTHYLGASFAIIISALFIGFFYGQQLPEQMVSHWNLDGEPDDTLAKPLALLLVPLAGGVILLLSYFLPKLDPLGRNIKRFESDFRLLILVIVSFLAYIHVLMIAWNLGARFDFAKMLTPGFSVLFFAIGIMLGKAKRNWFIGIRTPWTLSSDIVWNRTHKHGSKLFKVASAFILLSMFIDRATVLFLVVIALVLSLYLVLYSYYSYRVNNRKEKKNR